MASPETKYNNNTTRGTRYGIPEAIEFADGLANAAALIFGAVTCVATATGLRGGRRNVRNGWDAGGRSSSIEVIEGVAKLAGLAGCAIACATAVAHQWRARMGCALVVDDDHSCRAVLYYLTHVARQTKWAQVRDIALGKGRGSALAPAAGGCESSEGGGPCALGRHAAACRCGAAARYRCTAARAGT